MTDSSQLSRLERAADILEIRDALQRYCFGIDQQNLELAKSAFHEDSIEEHGPFKGKSIDLVTFRIPKLAGYDVLVRHLTNVSVEFIDHDSALSEAYWLAVMRQVGQEEWIQSGRYMDRFERRNGEWRIAARLAAMDWWRAEPRNSIPFLQGAEPILKWGHRGLHHPAIRSALLEKNWDRLAEVKDSGHIAADVKPVTPQELVTEFKQFQNR